MIRDRVRRRRCSHAQSRDRDGSKGEAGRMPQGPLRIEKVLTQHVPMGSGASEGNINRRFEPKQNQGEGVGSVAQTESKERAEFLGILEAKGSRVQEQQKPVQGHHTLPGAKPRPRAHLTSCDKRRVSAWPTCLPKPVMR